MRAAGDNPRLQRSENRMPRRRITTSLAAAAVAATLAASSPSGAQAPATDQGWSIWELSAYKTLTYEAMAQSFELASYYLILGGSAVGGAGFFVVNAGTAAVTYYAHEMAWQFFGPLPEPFSAWTLPAKAATYRAISIARTFGLGYLVAGDPVVATGFVIVAAIADTGLYVLNDYAWSLAAPPPPSAP